MNRTLAEGELAALRQAAIDRVITDHDAVLRA
jgi:hypothetical protein